MTRKEILTKFEDVFKLFITNIPKGNWMASAWESLDLDELDVNEIYWRVENEFNIKITHDTLLTQQNPNDLFEYLKDQLVEKPEPVYVPKTYFTSDLHLMHKGITKGTTKWNNTKDCRDFTDEVEMTRSLIDNINNTVGENDKLWCLGDFAIVNVKEWKALRDRIKCKTIHLVLGNHDPQSDLLENKWIKTSEGEGFHIGDLFASVQHVKMLKVKLPVTGEKQIIFLSHYSHRVWDQGQNGAWMLYGHSHGSLEEYSVFEKFFWEPLKLITNLFTKTEKKHMTTDVGVDVHPHFRPFSLEELVKLMKDRVPLNVDHHIDER